MRLAFFSPVSDVPAEPSALPSNPQISDFPSADIDEGACEISNAGSNRALDVSGGSCDNGANVQQYVLDHTNVQLWDFVARQDGGYFIKSGLGDYVLDISGGSVANGGGTHRFIDGTLRMHRFGISLRSLRLSMTDCTRSTLT